MENLHLLVLLITQFLQRVYVNQLVKVSFYKTITTMPITKIILQHLNNQQPVRNTKIQITTYQSKSWKGCWFVEVNAMEMFKFLFLIKASIVENPSSHVLRVRFKVFQVGHFI